MYNKYLEIENIIDYVLEYIYEIGRSIDWKVEGLNNTIRVEFSNSVSNLLNNNKQFE